MRWNFGVLNATDQDVPIAQSFIGRGIRFVRAVFRQSLPAQGWCAVTRAMWKGRIALGKQRLDVKMYSAIEDRSVRFHMLHKKDCAPVEQHIIRKDTGADVQREDIRKAFSISEDTAVILQPEDLEALQPPDSRDIQILRFVTPQAIDDQWYERPYYLGPEDDAESYFALAQALEDTKLIGISRWVMRKKRYVGALTSIDGYLAMTTMRRADQILEVTGVEPAAPLANELKLAEQLVSSISADFDPRLWQNEYRQRLLEVIDAKARGTKVSPIRAKQQSQHASLAASLMASIAEVREKKRA
jgi:DNA end-binding protein Ku